MDNDFLRLGGLKSFSDGSLGSTTAWFWEPYTDAPDTSGLPSDELADIKAWYSDLKEADRAGLQLVIHAIGDRANTFVLDSLERLIAGTACAIGGPGSSMRSIFDRGIWVDSRN